MRLIEPLALADMDAAARFVERAFHATSGVLERSPVSWERMQATRSANGFLLHRFRLMEHIGAAYATGDRGLFDSVADAVLHRPLSGAEWFHPYRSQLLFDLALCIGRRRGDVARSIAGRVLEAKQNPGITTGDLFATVLALLVDLQFEEAASTTTTIRELATAKRFLKDECEYALKWSELVVCVTSRDGSGLREAAATMVALRRNFLNRLLSRWNKGLNCDLSAESFWDWKTTAVLSVADSLGVWPDDANSSEVAFANWRWTEGRSGWE